MASLVNYGNDESDDNLADSGVEDSSVSQDVDELKSKMADSQQNSEIKNDTNKIVPQEPLPVGSPSKTTEELQAEWDSFAELIGMAGPEEKTNEVNHEKVESVDGINVNKSEVDVSSKQQEVDNETATSATEAAAESKVPKKSTGSSSSGSDNSSSGSSDSSSSSGSSDSESEDEQKLDQPKKSISPVKSQTENTISATVAEDVKKPVSKKERSRHSRSRNKDDRRKRSRSRSKRNRSRDRHRRHSRDRKSRRGRRSSRDRKHRSSGRDHRRRRRGTSRSRDTRRSRSRDRRNRRPSPKRTTRHRSRSASPRHRRVSDRSPSPANKKMTFKDQLRANFLKTQKDIEKGILPSLDEIEKKEVPVVPGEKPSNLPLYENPLLAATGGKPLSSDNAQATPQLAFLHTMAAMHQKAQELTGVSVPKYYNPAAVNPLKYAEQIQKRKLLWSKTKEKKEENKDQWAGTVFSQDKDGKVSAKFRKLMGIKGEASTSAEQTTTEKSGEEQKKKREELFQRLDQDYEFARMTTHTHRGIGLGFSSQQIPQPPPGYK